MPLRAVDRPCRGIEYVGLIAAATLALAAPAAAQTGGTTPTAPKTSDPLAPAATANLYGRKAPRIKNFACAGACAPGSLVRVTGRRFKGVDEVIFLGDEADGADDASVAPRRARGRALAAHVPRTAVAGRILVVRRDGTRSPATAQPLTVAPGPATPPAGAVDAEAQGHKVFFGGQRPAELSYVLGGTEPADVLVELIRESDATTIEQWTPGEVEPGVPQTIRWDGTAQGALQRDGDYRFRVTATQASGTRAVSSQVDEHEPATFTFLRYRFPLLGAHDYGMSGAGFGGGRGHQGHDVFAECGTPVVAARGGRVQFKQYHGRAGHYLVIDGARTGTDFAYMHLREAALVGEGDKVKTGQPIGFVGDTGVASECHLHFEEWTKPGWYDGGKPFDPLPDLKAWDAQS